MNNFRYVRQQKTKASQSKTFDTSAVMTLVEKVIHTFFSFNGAV